MRTPSLGVFGQPCVGVRNTTCKSNERSYELLEAEAAETEVIETRTCTWIPEDVDIENYCTCIRQLSAMGLSGFAIDILDLGTTLIVDIKGFPKRTNLEEVTPT